MKRKIKDTRSMTRSGTLNYWYWICLQILKLSLFRSTANKTNKILLKYFNITTSLNNLQSLWNYPHKLHALVCSEILAKYCISIWNLPLKTYHLNDTYLDRKCTKMHSCSSEVNRICFNLFANFGIWTCLHRGLGIIDFD